MRIKSDRVSACRLYLHYISINIRSMMQYKTSFFLAAVGKVMQMVLLLLSIYYMFRRFPEVKGFTYEEVLFCFALVQMEYSLAEMIARGFDAFSGMVRFGTFDQILVRPRNEILQVLGSQFEFSRIVRIVFSAGILVYAVRQCEIDWTAEKVLTVFFMIVGGTLLFSGLFLIYAALCFFTLESLEVINIFTDGARDFGRYPIGAYGPKMLLFCTFVIPYALVQYYPLLYVLERNSRGYYMFLPLLALWFLIPCYALWRFGVRRYQSSGS